MFGGLGFQELILIVLIILLLFGAKKIPELMKGLGKGIRSFKDGMNGTDDKTENADSKIDKTVDSKEEHSNNEQK
ncbi:MAG: twin-arginine translocase TatA/TatE family subunit [Bacteroidales bacterium]|nr:twin-arginine translocase TatA/TatE family subunit [Bacteroidales bacterium]MDD5974609.1 twin-arginine translocase TatA/TatE family subunit [Bacteroidales bacterium]MDY5194074.1 twin-arginine translocase TatA/TatE family subunit [Candidatus Aphodosoma sp.]